MSELSHGTSGRAKHCEDRLESVIQRRKEEAPPGDNVRLHFFKLLLDNIHKHSAFTRAADWVATL
eukprot:9740513-Prorocentrum_lima.AAC.1